LSLDRPLPGLEYIDTEDRKKSIDFLDICVTLRSMKHNIDSPTTAKYPLTSFQTALEVGQAVSEAGGATSDVQNPVIAQALGVSHTSGAFGQRLSSARTYGVIFGGRRGYRLTDAGKRYFFPSSETEKRQAMLEFLKTPPIFSDVINRFDGNKIPAPDMLANTLLREMNIPESWKARVARFFLKAAQDAGAIDSHGFLRYAASRHSMDGEPLIQSKTHIDTAPPPISSPTSVPSPLFHTPEDGMNAWVFSLNGKTVKVETSNALTPELWKKLNSYVQVLKPFEEDSSL
jgi:hypothetical protein